MGVNYIDAYNISWTWLKQFIQEHDYLDFEYIYQHFIDKSDENHGALIEEIEDIINDAPLANDRWSAILEAEFYYD